jgi:hypothetical protein
LRDHSRQLIIQKEGARQVIFDDFTTPPARPVLGSAKLEKYYRTDIRGYVIQIQLIQSDKDKPRYQAIPSEI